MVMNKTLIIEGTRDTRNGTLRQGFNKLLAQKLSGNMPRIIMGEGKSQAIAKFKKSQNHKTPHLLIDLDGNESAKSSDLEINNLTKIKTNVFYMIQEMEAWFLSQPVILDSYYSTNLSEKIPSRPAKDIPNPSDLLYKITEPTIKGKYHKVKHAVDLLLLLNADKLMSDFEDFNSLIEILNN
jgi:hypothetical protein